MIYYNGFKESLVDVLEIKKGITSFVGAGGKTTIINKIAKEIKESVAITTTTKIYIPKEYYEKVEDAKNCKKRIVYIGKKFNNEKLKMSIEAKDILKEFDYVLVEADGSKRLPIKMPNKNEPIIPKGNNKTILIAGIDALNKNIAQVCHRSEIVSNFLNKKISDVLELDDFVKIINFGYDNIDKVIINKIENKNDFENGKKIAKKSFRQVILTGGFI